MATVHYVFGSWASSGPANDLLPGQSMPWIGYGFDYGEVVSISAHPVVGAPVQRFLAVENVRILGDPGGRQVWFDVRNVGISAVPGYGMGMAWIAP